MIRNRYVRMHTMKGGRYEKGSVVSIVVSVVVVDLLQMRCLSYEPLLVQGVLDPDPASEIGQ
jgi:hypothetical protein